MYVLYNIIIAPKVLTIASIILLIRVLEGHMCSMRLNGSLLLIPTVQILKIFQMAFSFRKWAVQVPYEIDTPFMFNSYSCSFCNLH